MKENKMKTLRKLIPVIMLCLIPACPNDITWVTTDVSSTFNTSSTGNPSDSSGESTDDSSTSLTTSVTESSTTSIESSTSVTGSSTTLIESSTSETGAIIPVCGNSIVEIPEECDDGISGTGTAFCTYNCTISFCGDSIVNILDNEQCDDGNMSDLDSCNSKCQLPRN